VDEYSEVLITMVCAIYSSRIIPKEALGAMEGERLQAIIPHLVSFKEQEIADAALKADHAGIDLACGKSLLGFVTGLSAYLPEKISRMSLYLYGRWFDYLSHRLKPSADVPEGDPLNYGKEEFAEYALSEVEKMSQGLSADDKMAVQMLSDFVFRKKELRLEENRREHGLWALIDLLCRKTKESEGLSHLLHSSLVREEIWKKNLFAG